MQIAVRLLELGPMFKLVSGIEPPLTKEDLASNTA
jgi:hypothetical protein